MITCIIIDDEELARELVESHLNQLPEFELIASCSNALEARAVLQKTPIDLLFLDIEMPMIKGTDFFRSLSHKPKVIFTTAYRNYAAEGFDLNAVDYLVKPILFDRFLQGLDKFLQSQGKGARTHQIKSHLFVQANKKKIKVLLDDILYVESLKDYIQIYLPGQRLVVKFGLQAFMRQLDGRFLQVHRSFLVNLDKVSAFTKHDIEIGDKEIPIGETYKMKVLDYLK